MSTAITSNEAFAPATLANLAVGFDNLGLALNTIGDRVRVTKISSPEIIIKSITCEDYIDPSITENLPKDPKLNTSTAGLLKLHKDLNLNFGFEIEIKKGIPLGSGLGGSSASAVAALVAANELLPKQLSKDQLFPYTIEGEAAASGARHADNVAPCLYGGLTLIRPDQSGMTQIPIPKDLKIVVLYPGYRLDTKKAREVLPKSVSLQACVKASGRLASFISSCYTSDLDLMKLSLIDEIIEPAREHLISDFQKVKQSALSNHALGCSISGAGPSIFAICRSQDAENLEQKMKAALTDDVSKALSWISDINLNGAYILK